MSAEKIPVPLRLDEAKALSDEIRVFILDLLSKKPMSVHEIVQELKKRGLFKNINTIRYHLQVLKDAGLVELVRTEEVKGGVLKYYASKRKVYAFEVPEEVAKDIDPVINSIKEPLKSIILDVVRKHREAILDAAKKLKPCPYCVTKHFAEYIVLEAVKIAIGKILSDPDVADELSKFIVKEELSA
ncbi:MAG: hypothetical protein DRO23_09765 [Thermoprotei archaeon]|nr:MAG: hypothetical protein DRO23_09765 [Thermoprotei archaeon]